MSITINAIKKMWQRDDISGGLTRMPLGGTYTAENPASFEYRIRENGGPTVRDWTPLEETVIAGGVWNGVAYQVPPTKGASNWWRVDIRSKNSAGTVLSSVNGSVDFGVGAIVYFGGQSNIARWMTLGSGVPNVLTTLSTIDVGTLAVTWGTVTGQGAIAFANYLNNLLDIPIGLVGKRSAGGEIPRQGSALSRTYDLPEGWWSPYSLGDGFLVAYYATKMLEHCEAIEAFVWCQGETDVLLHSAFWGTGIFHKGDYISHFVELVNRFRDEVGDFPVFVVSLGAILTVAQDEQTASTLRDLLVRIGGWRHFNCYYASGHQDLVHDTAGTDTYHLTAAGYETLALRVARIMEYWYNGNYESGRGPRISLARFPTAARTTVHIHTVLGAGGALTPTSGIVGFEVWKKDGTPVAISSTEVHGTVIQLNLAAAADEGSTFAYLYGSGNGSPNKWTSNTVFDGAGMPMEPASVKRLIQEPGVF